MTYAELLTRLSGYGLPVGGADVPGATPQHLPSGPCDDILATLVAWCRIETMETVLSRSAVIDALGPLRLRYMTDPDAPITTFQLLTRFIEATDAAFDDAVLDRHHPLSS